MNPDELWSAIDTQRLRTFDVLDELTPRSGRPRRVRRLGWTFVEAVSID